ncbi:MULTISPECIES: P-loop NTPase [Sphingomonadaceae]|jgi:protein-tyrosine kinase|uniref:P-loop NTPase n=3 Tax=Sphingobium TaxID=165695 RepID=A0ABS8H3B5_9SPHN|nr:MULTISPECIES: P-loop NTPase [Sphingomonadaceae]MEC9017111.1 P-loop NTPase [Pseudomonadota bacterium]MBS46515.1 exopolysaccharide biosynthesis protein [Sphingobium sp.]MCC4233049.1 P-loop NTPase [Sphingobium soli]MCC4258501.1 P-loop NTPase [Sphingobium lactosutens]HCW62907.1 exopolysaccharide biosynthesis protein [Sphingobium sp.]
MNQHSSIKGRGSLIERATQIYDFSAALKGRAAPAVDVPADAPLPPPVDVPVAPGAPDAPVTRAPAWTGPVQPIDRDALAQGGFLLPEGPVTVMSEEFRLLKRDLLAQLRDNPRGNRILVCSPNSGEGKSFCAINLALSLAAEKDLEILLVDADFGSPSIPQSLGLNPGPGLMDALADPMIAIEDCIVRTDLPSLSVLSAGQRSNNDTEYLTSSRTQHLLARLTEGRPERVLIFDSPPLLGASPAAVLAGHAAIALLVVQADRTSESAVREAAALLKGGVQVRLLLNAARFTTGRHFGHYHDKGEGRG